MPRPTTVRAPATRDQADAYRFGLRRLEAALVRGDAVPLHEQIRSQRRAAMAGVALGLLGLCAAALYAVIGPKPDWRKQAVVSVAGSGALYAVDTAGEGRLVPVVDVAAARLVLAALGRTDAATAAPLELPDRAIANAKQTGRAPLPGADGARPEATIAPSWAVCDQVAPDGGPAGTTVIGGAAPVAPPDPGRAVLLAGPEEDTWLVTGGRRFRVDIGDGGLLAAYGLSREVPRSVNPTLLAMLPEGPELATPVVPDRGDPAPDGLPGRVGDVLVTDGAEYYVVLTGGVQQVPEVAADLLRVASGARAPRQVDAEVMADATKRRVLDVADWPAARPRLDDPAVAPVTCWMWTVAGEQTGEVWTGPALPLPPGARPVPLAQADGPGERVDAVWTGEGGAVRVDGPAAGPGAGGDSGGDSGSDSGSSKGSASDDSSAADPDDRDSTGDRSDGDRTAEDTGSASTADRSTPDRGSGAAAERSRTGADDPDAEPSASTSDRAADRSDPDAGESAGSRSRTSTSDEIDSLAHPGIERIDPLDGGGRVFLVAPNGVVHLVADEPTFAALGVATAEPAPDAVLTLLPAGPPLDLAAATAVVQNLR